MTQDILHWKEWQEILFQMKNIRKCFRNKREKIRAVQKTFFTDLRRRGNYAKWWQGDLEMKGKVKEEKRNKVSVYLKCAVELWRKEMVHE